MATGTQEITQQRLDKRLTGHTDECLFCGSNGLSFGSFETQDSTIYQEVECGDCGALWSDAYELQRVVSIPRPAVLTRLLAGGNAGG